VPEEALYPPNYREIAEDVIRKIASGEYPRGSVLPSTKELARHYGVGMGTIGRAMKVLQDDGKIIGRQGRGQFVL